MTLQAALQDEYGGLEHNNYKRTFLPVGGGGVSTSCKSEISQ